MAGRQVYRSLILSSCYCTLDTDFVHFAFLWLNTPTDADSCIAGPMHMHRHQFDFIMVAGQTKVHYEELGDGHGLLGLEACSPGKFCYFYMPKDQF